MEKSTAVLRVHHLISLRNLHLKERKPLFEGIQQGNGLKGPLKYRYPTEDLIRKAEFYSSIKADTPIVVMMGIDEVCKSCCNYDPQLGCTEFSEEQLMFEDQRTLEIVFPHLRHKVISGQPVYLSDIVQ